MQAGGSSYLLSGDPAQFSTSGPAYRGLLSSNLLGTQFRLLGRHSSCQHGKRPHRQELAAVLYDQVNQFR